MFLSQNEEREWVRESDGKIKEDNSSKNISVNRGGLMEGKK